MGRTSTAIYALARNTEKVCRQKRGKGVLINIWPSSRECLTYARPLPMQCPDLSAQPLTGEQSLGMHDKCPRNIRGATETAQMRSPFTSLMPPFTKTDFLVMRQTDIISLILSQYVECSKSEILSSYI